MALALAILAGAVLIGATTVVPGYGARRRAATGLRLGSRIVLAVLRVRVVTRGKPLPGPALVVANHTSWLDILVLCAGAPMLPVAKAEVAAWPVIGRLARRSGALFIDRWRYRELPDVVDRVAGALRAGHRVQVFPEGTTRCGASLDPFRRALFQAAIDAATVVSPVALRYRDGAGAPTTASCFVGDETLITSVWRVLRSRPLRVEVHWLPVVPAIVAIGHRATDRAAVATKAQDAVARALHQPVVPPAGAPRPDRPGRIGLVPTSGPQRSPDAGRQPRAA